MKLYISPGACSMASNIALREAGIPFEMSKVDKRTKRADGVDFVTINPKGYVPALRLDDGQVLTENVAVLQYIGEVGRIEQAFEQHAQAALERSDAAAQLAEDQPGALDRQSLAASIGVNDRLHGSVRRDTLSAIDRTSVPALQAVWCLEGGLRPPVTRRVNRLYVNARYWPFRTGPPHPPTRSVQ